ncbi:hypothetical protein STAFG_1349 [Streptomyces afghaniensis 772]|uniref:Uncharacterized protein n=1 Tax=Streptomyces afghaniensis 772 TaxID=1283301 RepID=S4N2R6_9ACTN|nr:hypothetical protein STAFG_1349 [Streptomyces afghaniensis 772]
MEWLSAENLVAVATAVLGIIASGVMVWYERRVPRRKRIGYRVQMDNPIGDDVRSGRANRRLGLFDEAPDMTDATLVLLRIENDGSLAIDRDDYTGPEVHGLTAVFTDRTIRGVSVTQPSDTEHLMDHFTAARGFGYEDNTLRIPRVPLNRGDHFKLLVLLSGGDVGREVRLTGGLREGEVRPNRAAAPDDTPPLFSRAARLITIMLTLCVVTLAAIVVAQDDTPPRSAARAAGSPSPARPRSRPYCARWPRSTSGTAAATRSSTWTRTARRPGYGSSRRPARRRGGTGRAHRRWSPCRTAPSRPACPNCARTGWRCRSSRSWSTTTYA